MKKWILALVAAIILFTLPGLAEKEIAAWAQLNERGITVGVDQGSAAELTVRELLPQATVAYFTDKFMGYTAVAQGKIDAFVYDRLQMQLAIEEGQTGVRLLDENLGDMVKIGVGLSPVSRIPDLENKINQFIEDLRADGTLADMYERWVIREDGKMPRITLPGSPSLHLTVGTTGVVPPYSYYQDGQLNGYDIELAYRFAAWLGADVEFKVYDYGAIVPAALTGDVDCVMANLNVTPERQEVLTFSDILYENSLGIMVQGEAAADNTAATVEPAPAWAAYNGKRLGVLVGPLMEDIAHANFPDSEYMLFNSYPDCITALVSGRIDAYLGDEPGLKSVHAEQPQIDYIHERITNQEYSFAFRKDDPESAKLCEELNAFLAQSHADGTMQELDDIWFGVDESRKVVDMSDLTGEKGTIRVVTTSTDMPWSYIKDGKNVGYDIDLVVRFCRHAGYRLELGDVDFAARIPAIQSGKYDFTTDMNVTEERKEQVLFSDPTSSGGVVLAILTDGAEAKADPAATAETLSPLAWNGRRMGIVTGSSFEAATLKNYPNSEYLYYNTNSDVVTALITGKIDGFLGDEPVIRVMCQEVPEMTYLPEMLTHDDYAFGFGKNTERADRIRGQFNEMLAEILTDGTMDAMLDKWFGSDEAAKMVDLTNGYSGENGKLNVVTNSADMPFSYMKDGKPAGLVMEMVELFCRRYGYTPVIEDVDFAARIPGLVSGKYDMCASSMAITEERKESINFSEPFYQGGIVLAVRKADMPETAAAQPAPAALTFDQFVGKTIGVQVGTTSGAQVEAKIPTAKLAYYNTQTDLLAALRAGKIDAWGTDETVPKFLMMENDDLQILDGYLDTFELAAMFAKNEKGQALCAQYSAFVDSLWADGTMAALDDIWFGQDDAKRQVQDYEALPATNGTLRMAVDTYIVPFAYVKDNRVVGYDVDIAARFCQQNGYRLVVEPMDFGGVLPSVQSGKVDFAACGITITEERKESVLFSSANYKTGAVLAVLKSAEKMATEAKTQAKKITLDDLNGKRIGVVTGTISGRLAEKRLPDAQVNYFNAQTDCLAALQAGKTDAWSTDEPILRYMQIEYPQLEILDERLAESNLAAVFPKTEAGQALRDQFSEFLDKKWADGTMAEIDAIWFGADEAKRTVLDYESLPATNGTLHMAADLIQPPFSYMKEGRAVGYDIDVAARFCQEYGYGLEIQSMSFDGVLAAVQTGKCDFACSCITVTEERAESMLFSTPDYYGGIAVAVWNENSAAGQSAAQVEIGAISQLDGMRIGVQTGTTFDAIVLEALPNAKISYFNSYPDMAAALEAHKIDGFPGDEPVLLMMTAEDPQLAILSECMDIFETGFAMPKTEAGEKLLGELNAWIASMQESGDLEKIVNKWTVGKEADKTLPDYAAFPAPNGMLTLATEGAYPPFNYYREGKVVGMEIDLAAQFCQANGYGLKVEAMNFDGILPAVQTGKANFAAAGISITEERKESVNFSDPYYIGGTVMAVLKTQPDKAGIPAGVYTSLSQLSGKKIGVQTGTSFDKSVAAAFPDAQIEYYNSKPDMINALQTYKIDAYAVDEPVAKAQMQQNDKLTYIPEYMESFDFAYVFAKNDAGQALCDQFSEYLNAIQADGTMAEIEAKWFSEDESVKTLADYEAFPATNCTLNMATEAMYEPFSYVKGNEIVGYDIDIVVRFCQAYGYGLTITDMSFDAVLPAVQSGKCDFGGAGITITEERKESVLFSSPNFSGGTVMAVLKAESQPAAQAQPAAAESTQSAAPAAAAPSGFSV
ncbi:MAG: transporter substrate-binding domain-containing protein, partial [Clostridia bacterium]|nr:transporter substrate-binding domain-containing protein [Clostridia bacterium]